MGRPVQDARPVGLPPLHSPAGGQAVFITDIENLHVLLPSHTPDSQSSGTR